MTTNIQQATTVLTFNVSITAVNNDPSVVTELGQQLVYPDGFPNLITRTINNQVIVTAGTTVSQGRMGVTNSNTQIPIGTIEVVGYYHLVNCGTFSAIKINDSSGNELCSIPCGSVQSDNSLIPGGVALIPANAPLYASCASGENDLQYFVTEYLGMLSIPSGDEAY